MVSPITIRIRRKAGCADIDPPRYMSEHASGMDVCAACESDVTIAPGDVKLIPCGFYMAVPVGYEAQMRPRSGRRMKNCRWRGKKVHGGDFALILQQAGGKGDDLQTGKETPGFPERPLQMIGRRDHYDSFRPCIPEKGSGELKVLSRSS